MWIRGKDFVRFLDLMERIKELEKNKSDLSRVLYTIVMSQGGKITIPQPGERYNYKIFTDDNSNLIIQGLLNKGISGEYEN